MILHNLKSWSMFALTFIPAAPPIPWPVGSSLSLVRIRRQGIRELKCLDCFSATLIPMQHNLHTHKHTQYKRINVAFNGKVFERRWKKIQMEEECDDASERIYLFIYLSSLSPTASAISAPWHWTHQTMKCIPLKPSASNAHKPEWDCWSFGIGRGEYNEGLELLGRWRWCTCGYIGNAGRKDKF